MYIYRFTQTDFTSIGRQRQAGRHTVRQASNYADVQTERRSGTTGSMRSVERCEKDFRSIDWNNEVRFSASQTNNPDLYIEYTRPLTASRFPFASRAIVYAPTQGSSDPHHYDPRASSICKSASDRRDTHTRAHIHAHMHTHTHTYMSIGVNYFRRIDYGIYVNQ